MPVKVVYVGRPRGTDQSRGESQPSPAGGSLRAVAIWKATLVGSGAARPVGGDIMPAKVAGLRRRIQRAAGQPPRDEAANSVHAESKTYRTFWDRR